MCLRDLRLFAALRAGRFWLAALRHRLGSIRQGLFSSRRPRAVSRLFKSAWMNIVGLAPMHRGRGGQNLASGAIFSAPYFVAGGLLVLSGITKLRRPRSVAIVLHAVRIPAAWRAARLVGIAELGIGLAALLHPVRTTVIGVAVLYAAFAAVIAHVLLAKIPIRTCGCAGERDVPPSWIHVTLNTSTVAVIALCAWRPPPSLPSSLGELRFAAIPFALALGAAAFLAYYCIAVLPSLLIALRPADPSD